MNIKRKILSLLLTATMVCALLPTPVAMAADSTVHIDYGNITISQNAGSSASLDVTYYTSSGAALPTTETIPASDNIVITQTDSGTSTSNTITVSASITNAVNIILSNVNVDVSATSGACAFSIESGSTVNLTLTGTNTLKSGAGCAGLQVPKGATLTVTKDSTGTLSATGGDSSSTICGGAGIGGGTDSVNAKTGGDCGTVTINGGTVTATGGKCGTGIGGGSGIDAIDSSSNGGSGGTVTISGGKVTANGGMLGAGIGGGLGMYMGGTGGNITISGGTVIATSGGYGAGIGGGMGGIGVGGAGGNITISGGTVIANADSMGTGIGGGAGIGVGGAGGNITISGGTVIANAGSMGTGIGGGVGGADGGAGGNITISGGTVTATGGVASSSYHGGVGIGGAIGQTGKNGNSGTVTITAGTVTATGGTVSKTDESLEAGIDGNNGAVVISGGSVNATVDTTVYSDSAKTIPVYLTTVSVSGINAATDVKYIADASDALVCATDKNGKLYLWLAATSAENPERTVLVSILTAYYQSSGEVETDNTSTMTATAFTPMGLTIAAQPSEQVTAAGGTATLTVTAAGSGTLAYQWYKSTTTSNSGGTAISGATGSSLTVSPGEPGLAYYYCVITKSLFGGESETKTSDAAAVYAVGAKITAQPSAQATLVGGKAALSVTAAGTGDLTYQWYQNMSNSNSGGMKISGATDSTYTAPTAVVGTTYYYCVVTAAIGSVSASETSDPAAVYVVDATTSLSIVEQPTDMAAASGGTADLSVAALGTGTLTYQWYKNTTDANSGGKSISGATGSTYSAPTTYTGTLYYYCVITDTVGTLSESLTSEAAAVTVTDASSGSGNGAYSITPDVDSAYTAGLTSDGKFPTMTVKTGVTGFTYFSVTIAAVTGHSGMETAVFVQNRNGQQIAFSFLNADFDTVDKAGAGFNVKPGDVIEVYLVDSLSNNEGSPSIL